MGDDSMPPPFDAAYADADTICPPTTMDESMPFASEFMDPSWSLPTTDDPMPLDFNAAYANAAYFCPPMMGDQPQPTNDELDEAVKQFLQENPDPNGSGFASADAESL
jgi:hypothetical protein